ncbi:MAG: response regulator transcription factor [Candidatus Omnitrophica bacterium]|nr:response regulator transcription factor [Candidatus Omnitrophota bacterium]
MIVLAVVDDLLFQAKIREAAAPLGIEVRIAKTLAQAQDAGADPAVVVVDLNVMSADPLEVVRALRAHHPAVAIIGYGSHVQAELLAQARAAGCTTVLPRSAFVQQLSTLLTPVDSEHRGHRATRRRGS